MNDRLELIGEREVRLRLGEHINAAKITVECGCDTLFVRIPTHILVLGWDAGAYRALRDCINCLEATGSFAALADTSAVPFVGKEVCTSHGRGVVMQVGDGDKPAPIQVRQESGSNIWFSKLTLTPIAPPQKVRGFRTATEFEVARGFDRLVATRESKIPCGHFIEITAVPGKPLRLRFDGYSSHVLADRAAELYEWADTGEPCGIVEATWPAGER